QFRAVHLLEGRGDLIGEGPLSLRQRMRRHAWPRLRATLEQLVESYRPDLVQIEFMELARLIEDRVDSLPWLLSLHDVTIGVDSGECDEEQQLLINEYAGVAVCSPEDAALLQREDAHMVRNGATDRRSTYQQSTASPPTLLFMGPLRYGPNRSGITLFLDHAWLEVCATHPNIRLVILGGIGAKQLISNETRFADPRIELIDRYVDPGPYLAAATLTLNPLVDIRGSSLKLMESLLAGRVCVTTVDGARGLGDDAPAAAEICIDITAMAAPISRLIADDEERHRRESPLDVRLDVLTWTASADAQAKLYEEVLAARAMLP
ncbi:MAG: glycosyltransferase family 4 protein, partial [Dokdonella sp.]